MFGVKKLEKQLRKEFNEDLRRGSEIMTKLSEKISKLDSYVECSTCGCLVNRSKAKKVQTLVAKTINIGTCLGIDWHESIPDENEIKTDYYCQHCKNEKNTTKKKKSGKK